MWKNQLQIIINQREYYHIYYLCHKLITYVQSSTNCNFSLSHILSLSHTLSLFLYLPLSLYFSCPVSLFLSTPFVDTNKIKSMERIAYLFAITNVSVNKSNGLHLKLVKYHLCLQGWVFKFQLLFIFDSPYSRVSKFQVYLYLRHPINMFSSPYWNYLHRT